MMKDLEDPFNDNCKKYPLKEKNFPFNMTKDLVDPFNDNYRKYS